MRSGPLIDDDADAPEVASATRFDALELLRQDHLDVQALFDTYEAGLNSLEEDRKQGLAERICSLLLVHGQIEEEIFYPAARDAIDAEGLLDEAEVEHGVARELIEQIQAMDPEDALYDAKVRVLGEYVRHHVVEEEDRLFPLVELADIDLDELGAQMQERRLELFDEYGLETSE